MSSFVDRVKGAIALDAAVYEEVEHDREALLPAMAVVLLSTLATGIGSAGFHAGLLISFIAALLGWIIWAALTWLIGTKLLPEPQTEADIGQMMRTLGFAAAPGLIAVLGIIPLIGGLFVFAAAIWMLFATIVAVRQALDYSSTLRAVGVVVIGWIIYVALRALIT